MGSLSPWHWAILAVVVILLFGAKKLPDAARSLGKSMRIFKSEMREMQSENKADAPHRNPCRGPHAGAVAASRPAGGHRAGSHRSTPGLARRHRRGARAPLTERRESVQDFSAHCRRAEATQSAQQAQSHQSRRDDVAGRPPDRAAHPAADLAGRDPGHHDFRVRLVLAFDLRAGKPRRVAAPSLLFAAAVGARGYQRRRAVPIAGHRPVRPVHAAAQGRDDGRDRAGLSGVVLRAVGVHHARAVPEGTPLRGRRS